MCWCCFSEESEDYDEIVYKSFSVAKLSKFRNIDTEIESADLEIPAPPAERTTTDKKGLYFYGLGLALWILVFTIQYCFNHQLDIRRLFYSHDHCGNFCGFSNHRDENIPCSGQDYKYRPYSNLGNCVEMCPSDSKGRVCSPINDAEFDELEVVEEKYKGKKRNVTTVKERINFGWENITVKILSNPKDEIEKKRSNEDAEFEFRNGWHYWKYAWPKFVANVVITIGFYILFAKILMPWKFTWVVVVLISLCTLAAMCHSFYLITVYFQPPIDRSLTATRYVYFCIVVFLPSIIFCSIFFSPIELWLEEINLINKLFKMATAHFWHAESALIFLILIFKVALLAFSIFYAFPLLASAKLEKIGENRYEFEKFGVAQGFSMLLNLFMLNWTMQLLAGFQCINIAGHVACWYFAEDKKKLICDTDPNYGNRFCFHWGSAAFGALLQPILAVVRRIAIFNAGLKKNPNSFMMEIAYQNYEKNNAFILIGLHGQEYWKSGQRAHSLMVLKAPAFVGMRGKVHVASLAMKLCLVLCSTGTSTLLFLDSDNIMLPVVICLLTNIVLVGTFFTTIETAVHTLLLCFCEDKFLNGDTVRPHHDGIETLAEFFSATEANYVVSEENCIRQEESSSVV